MASSHVYPGAAGDLGRHTDQGQPVRIRQTDTPGKVCGDRGGEWAADPPPVTSPPLLPSSGPPGWSVCSATGAPHPPVFSLLRSSWLHALTRKHLPETLVAL